MWWVQMFVQELGLGEKKCNGGGHTGGGVEEILNAASSEV
jgi:hypothetical protein